MKKCIKVVLLVLCILSLVGVSLVLWASGAAKKQLASLVYQDVNMMLVTNGTHYGQADAGLVSVKVAVVVKDQSIEDIQIIEHENGLGQAAEGIIRTMIEKNSFSVDAISGATLSSEAIKSAVSQALKASQAE